MMIPFMLVKELAGAPRRRSMTMHGRQIGPRVIASAGTWPGDVGTGPPWTMRSCRQRRRAFRFQPNGTRSRPIRDVRLSGSSHGLQEFLDLELEAVAFARQRPCRGQQPRLTRAGLAGTAAQVGDVAGDLARRPACTRLPYALRTVDAPRRPMGYTGCHAAIRGAPAQASVAPRPAGPGQRRAHGPVAQSDRAAAF